MKRKFAVTICLALLTSGSGSAYAEPPHTPAPAPANPWQGVNVKVVNLFGAPPFEAAAITLWNTSNGSAAQLLMAGPTIKIDGLSLWLRVGFADNYAGSDRGVIEVGGTINYKQFGLFFFDDVYPGFGQFQQAAYLAVDWNSPSGVSLGAQVEEAMLPLYAMAGPHIGYLLPRVGPVTSYVEAQYLAGSGVGVGFEHKLTLLLVLPWGR